MQAVTQAENAAREVRAVRELTNRDRTPPSRLTEVESELLELAAAGLEEATAALNELRQAISTRRERSNGH